jgi:hypothetical protein
MPVQLQCAKAAIRWPLTVIEQPPPAGIVWPNRLALSTGHTDPRRASRALRTIVLGVLTAAMAASTASASGPPAQASRTLNATDTGHLKYIPKDSEGATLVEEGAATGKLPGRMRANLKIEATFSGSFVLYTAGGTLKGHGTATPSGSGRYESFHGSLVVSGGTGRYAHARGKAGLYGVYDRYTHGVTVQTTGSISY